MGERDSWSKGIKAEIIDMKLRITGLEALVKTLGAPVASAQSGKGQSAASMDKIYNEYVDESVDELTEQATSKYTGNNEYLDNMVRASYSIREASTAMRGYLMLLDQAGLNKDQKKMIRDLENGMMSVMKFANALKYALELKKMWDMAQLAGGAIGPQGIIMAIIGGGAMAASLAFGSKVSGGNT
jgi:transcriptional regulator of aromatic amino acid metabolism